MIGLLFALALTFDVPQTSEVVAHVRVRSAEPSLTTLRLNGKPQQIMTFAAPEDHSYSVFLGELSAGSHKLAFDGAPQVLDVRYEFVAPGDLQHTILANAPVLYARKNTIGTQSDIPLVAYCERLMEQGQPVLQYTVIFSNEDGGTSTRALMARWGRTTDIEYLYKAYLGPDGKVVRATVQGRNHQELPFDGARDGQHPVLIPVTNNNMVSGQGTSEVRYQLAPKLVDLSHGSRELVMDDNPVTYAVMLRELQQEGKLRPFGVVDGQKISDPRNYAFIEYRGSNRDAALGITLRRKGDDVAYSSDLGRLDYAISRDGWVRTTVELPPGTAAGQLEEIGFRCYALPEAISGECSVLQVRKVFLLGKDGRPGPNIWSLTKERVIPAGHTAQTLF